jgi:cytoskeletal protein RodZ
MKKLLTTILLLSFLLIPSVHIYAQEEETLDSTIEQNIEEENDTEEQEKETLSDTLEEKEVEEIQPPSPSFFTILASILIPSIFIIICYLILKFFKF